MSRKAQFYVFDAFFAAIVLFVGAGLIFSDYVSTPDQAQAQTLSQDAATALFARTLGETDDPYIAANYQRLQEELTPIQQAHIWYHNSTLGCTGCLNDTRDLLGNLTDTLVPEQFGLAVLINDTTLYTRSIERDPEALISSRDIIITQWNLTESIGPAVAEVRLWQ